MLDETLTESNELVVYFLHNVWFPFLGLPSSYEQILKDGRFELFYKLLILNQVFNQFSYLKGFQLDLVNLETSWRKYLLEISGIFIRQLLGHPFKQGWRYNIFVKERPNNRNKTTYCKFVKNNTKLYSAFADFKKSNIDASYHHMQQ